MKKKMINLYCRLWAWLLIPTFVIIGLVSCIENDIPYPTVRLQITEIQFEGQKGQPVIDNEARVVTVNLADTVDLRHVTLQSISFAEKETESELHIGQEYDLSDSYVVQLSMYDSKSQWTIVAKQEILRVFKVENQIGEAEISVTEHSAIAMVSKETSLRRIRLLDLKLGPEGSVIDGQTGLPQLKWHSELNYATTQVRVTYKDIIVDEVWTLYVFVSENTVRTTSVDAWTQVAWLYGQGSVDSKIGFEIKEQGSEIWDKVDDAAVTQKGGEFIARVLHLKPQTTYTCRAFSEDEYGEELTFTTGKLESLPDGSFDEWHKDPNKQKVWNPWKEGEPSYWDSGNDGATTMGESNTVPTNDSWNGKGLAAMLQSKFVGLGSIGKFASGNIFMGSYVKTDGTNGILSFGVPFVERPTKLKGYYRYKTVPITDIPNESNKNDYQRFKSYLGQPDTCFIYAALGDWNEPVEIRTRPSNRKLFDPNDPHVIAYTELTSGNTSESYVPFELEFDYRSTDRVPKYLVLVCSTSKNGDYFVGGNGAVLWVDDFSLLYDY